MNASYHKPRTLEPESDKVKEVDELTENDALRRGILVSGSATNYRGFQGESNLATKITELLDESLNLGRRTPRVQVQPSEYTLTGRSISLDLKSRGFEVDRERHVAHRTRRLQGLRSKWAINGKLTTTHSLLDRSVEVLLDALAIKHVVAFGFDGILDNVVAETADDSLAIIVGQELALVVLAAEDEVWMARHLPHTRQQAEDVRVV
jgi:hypothetical protein